MTATIDTTPAGILAFQSECIRTGNLESLGRMQKIAIGPNASYVAPPNPDPVLAKFGRFIELRDKPLPLAQTRDRSMLLVPGVLLDSTGRVSLPDLPDPNWIAPPPTQEEIEGVQVFDQTLQRMVTKFPTDSPRSHPRMIPQSLLDRAESRLQGTNYLVFSPVIGITFQPEINKRMVGDAWLIDCRFNHADRTSMALLIDEKTGEIHFFGGCYEILGSSSVRAQSPRGNV
jgi:hypothetical protein